MTSIFLLAGILYALAYNISGVVTDTDGDALVGASLRLLRSKDSTVVKAAAAEQLLTPMSEQGVLLVSKPFSNTLFLQAIHMAAASNHRLQVLRQENTPLPVQLTACGIREQRTHLALLDVGHGTDLVGKRFPVFTAVSAQASIHRQRDIKNVAQLIAELCGDEKTPLIVKRMLILAGHWILPLLLYYRATLHHNHPHHGFIIEVVNIKCKQIFLTFFDAFCCFSAETHKKSTRQLYIPLSGQSNTICSLRWGFTARAVSSSRVRPAFSALRGRSGRGEPPAASRPPP